MTPDRSDTARHPGGLLLLLSSPEGSLFWAAGMRIEIQSCTGHSEFDCEYVGDCLRQLLRVGGWRQLWDSHGDPFPSFIHFCYAPRPQGLGFTRAQVEAALTD